MAGSEREWKRGLFENGGGRRLVAALLGEGWPHTLPLCLALGTAQLAGWRRAVVPFLGLTEQQRLWTFIGGAALVAAQLGRVWLMAEGLEIALARGAQQLFPWGWMEDYVHLVVRSLGDGWTVAARRDGALELQRAGARLPVACGPLGSRGRLPEGALVVTPLPWERGTGVVPVGQLRGWLLTAAGGRRNGWER